MSKGSDLRPRKVDKKTFDKNWDRIFNQNKRKKRKASETRALALSHILNNDYLAFCFSHLWIEEIYRTLV